MFEKLQQVSSVGITVFMVCALAGGVGTALWRNPLPVGAGVLVGFYFLFAIQVVPQWQKVALLRFGRYKGLRGPGMFAIIPVVDNLSPYVDQRVRVTKVTAETALTRDTVPVNVDAIVFWVVWNVEKSILEVENFIDAITMSAQTALRESIGRHELAQMITERDTLGHELQRILDEKTNPWGITVQSVEIRDVHIPQALEDAMSRQAQAERERQARIFISFAPVSNSRNLEFLRWLGVDIPSDLDRFLLGSEEGESAPAETCLARSIDLAQRILMDVFDNLPPDPPPIGLNIEHITARNFAPALAMLDRLGNLYAGLVQKNFAS